MTLVASAVFGALLWLFNGADPLEDWCDDA